MAATKHPVVFIYISADDNEYFLSKKLFTKFSKYTRNIIVTLRIVLSSDALSSSVEEKDFLENCFESVTRGLKVFLY